MQDLTAGGNTEKLEPIEADTVSEIGNISMGAAATALSMLLDRRVTITAPRVSLTTAQEIKAQYPVPCVVVSVRYLHGLNGDNVLIIRERDAKLIAGLMMGEPDRPPQQLDEISISAVAEAMNQMMGSTATAMSEMFRRSIDISPPEVVYKDLAGEEAKINGRLESEPLVLVSFSLHVDDLLDSELIQLLPVDFARQMAGELMELLSIPYPASPSDKADAPSPAVPQAVAPEPQQTSKPQPAAVPEKFSAAEWQGSFVPLDLIRDIPVRISGVFGRRMLTLRELLNLTGGAVVELDAQAADPVEILANGKLVARGEVVLVGENYGLKIIEIIKPSLDSN